MLSSGAKPLDRKDPTETHIRFQLEVFKLSQTGTRSQPVNRNTIQLIRRRSNDRVEQGDGDSQRYIWRVRRCNNSRSGSHYVITRTLPLLQPVTGLYKSVTTLQIILQFSWQSGLIGGMPAVYQASNCIVSRPDLDSFNLLNMDLLKPQYWDNWNMQIRYRYISSSHSNELFIIPIININITYPPTQPSALSRCSEII